MTMQSLETFKETQKKEGEWNATEKETSQRLWHNELPERDKWSRSKQRAVKIEFKRKEMENQSELQREELKMRKKELHEKGNKNEAMHQQMMMQQQQPQLLMQLLMQQQ